jgi:hypothetical protein
VTRGLHASYRPCRSEESTGYLLILGVIPGDICYHICHIRMRPEITSLHAFHHYMHSLIVHRQPAVRLPCMQRNNTLHTAKQCCNEQCSDTGSSHKQLLCRRNMTLEFLGPCIRFLGPTGMVGGVETSCHTRLPFLNYAGSNVQPSVTTHSLCR